MECRLNANSFEFLLSLGLAVILGGCYQGADVPATAGQGEDTGGDDAGGGGGDDETGGADDGSVAGLVPGPGGMRRLTNQQYANSIADVFGPEVQLDSLLEPDESTEAFLSIGAFKVGTSELGVEQYQDAAYEIALQVFGNRASYPLLDNCRPTDAADPCISEFIGYYGLRLWRRPLTDEELQRHVALVSAEGTTEEALDLGLQYALAALLQSLNFVYVVQVGEPDSGSAFLRYTDWEMASRLSYGLWDSVPDDALLEAAERGELVTHDGVREQAERMLLEPRARGLATRFFAENFGVLSLSESDKNPEVYPLWTAELVDALKKEFEWFLEDLVVERDGDIREIFDAKTTFVDPVLAEFYGLPAPETNGDQAELDDTRWGLLTSGAVIAANSPSDRTSPTHRGKFVLEQLLCSSVPPPPPNVSDELPTDEEDTEPETLREILERHRNDPTCSGCHSLMDPLGFTFENYSGIGEYRTEDNGLPVDAAGEFEGTQLDSVADLAAYLRQDERTGPCIARQLFRFAVGHEIADGEQVAIDDLSARYAEDGHSFQGLVIELVSSEGFRLLAATE
jgi:hypothetical protein